MIRTIDYLIVVGNPTEHLSARPSPQQAKSARRPRQSVYRKYLKQLRRIECFGRGFLLRPHQSCDCMYHGSKLLRENSVYPSWVRQANKLASNTNTDTDAAPLSKCKNSKMLRLKSGTTKLLVLKT